ncbi:hypothetical protein FRB99_001832 [Tulasnella sp. 403]|nr:hypothetical protein FRB99_001832 [Tulasnella sp. 403]
MLPVALQLALLSFWMGLTDFLWSLHHTVAHVALGFAILGAVFYFYTVVASAIDPDCPFQTPVTTIFLPRLRQLLIVPQAIGVIVLYILVYASFFVTYWITNILVLLTSPIWLPIVWAKRHALGEMVKQYSPILLAKFQLWGSSIVPWVAQYWYNWKQVGSGVATIPRETSNEVTEVESVAWLLTTSTDEKALVEAANNIITLRSPKMVRRLTFPSIPYAQLLIQLRERLVRIQLHLDGTSHSDDAAISEDARAAVVYSRAVLHVVLPSWLPPEFSLGPWGDKYAQDALAAMRSLTPGDEPSPLDEVLLFKLIWSPLEDVDPFLKIIRWVNPAVLPLYLAASLERLKTITVDDPKFGWTIVEQDRWKNARALVTAELAASCIAEAPCETTALNMVSFSLFAVITSLRLVWDIGVSSHRTARWLAYTSDRDLVPNLSGALAVYPIYVVFSNTTGRTDLSRLPFREIYIRLLNQLRNRFMESDKRMKYHTINLRLWWSRLLGAMQAILSPIDQSHKDVLAISNDAELEHEATVRREVILLMQLFLELVVGIDAVAHPGEASASLEADSRPSAIALWQLASSPRDVKHPDPLAALLNLISFASFANREHHLGLFRSYPPSITTFTNALAHPSPDVRTAALRTMSTFATEWFDHQEADIHDFFTDADLAKALARCARHELSPPISNRQVTAPLLAVVQNLITWPGWRRALPRAFFTELESVDTDDETLHVTLTALWMEVWYLSSQPVSEPTTNKGDTLDSEDLFPDGYVPRATHLVRFMNTSESGGDMLSNTGLVAALRAYATRVKEQRPDGGTAFLAEYEQLERTVDTSPPTNGIDPMADTPGPSSNAS